MSKWKKNIEEITNILLHGSTAIAQSLTYALDTINTLSKMYEILDTRLKWLEEKMPSTEGEENESG